ncbi:hypothetical protein FIBSPDRAFT_959803 [Athelia psychrophila]|uniref:Uncharacterized protein n=1 Tax=Athelia psychrophila TaxID=1759441 RepID=A0A166D1R2_9AGAM|nr:hypothetical protein FIBSPDRAFT_959803 [Fibularhizoctonia sp. CBS 109695]
MALLPCRSRGCDYKTTTGNGLSRHRKQCNHYKLELAAGHAQKALIQQNTLLRILRARESALTRMDCDEPDAIPQVPLAAVAPPSSPAPPLPLANPEGRPKRKRRLPPRYVQDMTPEAPAPIPPVEISVTRRVILIVRDTIRTGANKFGLWREYPHRPSVDPDQFVPATNLRSAETQTPTSTAASEPRARYWPFANMSIYLMMDWMHTGSSMKSVGEVDKLSQSVLSHPEFKLEDISGFSARTQNKIYDASDKPDAEKSGDQDRPDAMLGDGWIESTVDITIPLGLKHHSETEAGLEA